MSTTSPSAMNILFNFQDNPQNSRLCTMRGNTLPNSNVGHQLVMRNPQGNHYTQVSWDVHYFAEYELHQAYAALRALHEKGVIRQLPLEPARPLQPPIHPGASYSNTQQQSLSPRRPVNADSWRRRVHNDSSYSSEESEPRISAGQVQQINSDYQHQQATLQPLGQQLQRYGNNSEGIIQNNPNPMHRSYEGAVVPADQYSSYSESANYDDHSGTIEGSVSSFESGVPFYREDESPNISGEYSREQLYSPNRRNSQYSPELRQQQQHQIPQDPRRYISAAPNPQVASNGHHSGFSGTESARYTSGNNRGTRSHDIRPSTPMQSSRRSRASEPQMRRDGYEYIDERAARQILAHERQRRR